MGKWLNHAAISVGDMDKALAFYRDLLGWKVTKDAVNNDFHDIAGLPVAAARVVVLSRDEDNLELFQWKAPKPQRFGRRVCDLGFTHVAIRVEDLDAVCDTLRAAGVQFTVPPQGRSAVYCFDFEGNVVELQRLGTPYPPLPKHS